MDSKAIETARATLTERSRELGLIRARRGKTHSMPPEACGGTVPDLPSDRDIADQQAMIARALDVLDAAESDITVAQWRIVDKALSLKD